MAFGRETNFGFYFVFGICTFFIWCDLGFFSELSDDTKVFGNSTVSDHPPATIKLRMQDHFAHYLYLPFCNWLESVFKISEIPGVTPNLITLMHFILAIIAGRLAAEPGLSWRRLGVIIFEIRSVLDILDGVVFRAQSHNPKFLSGHGTLGWYLDSGADIFGSLFFAVGVMVLYNRYPPVKNKSRLRDTKFKDEESAVKLLSDGSADEDDGSITKRSRFSRRAINITILLYAFQVFIRSALWDHFLQAYNSTLQQKVAGVSPVSFMFHQFARMPFLLHLAQSAFFIVHGEDLLCATLTASSCSCIITLFITLSSVFVYEIYKIANPKMRQNVLQNELPCAKIKE